MAFLQKDVPSAKAQARRPAGRVRSRPSRSCRTTAIVEMKFIEYNMAKPAVRRARVPAARPDLRRGRARQAADDHLRPRVASGQGGQGDQGARGLHGRSAPDDRLRLLHRQRHRARDRQPAAPLARRVLRARQGQDAQLGQAAVLRAHHSVPRLVAGLRVRPEGHPVLPRRPPPQDAGDDPAQGHRPEPGVDPGALLRQRQLPPDGHRRADGIRARAPARRSRAFRHHRQERQRRRREGQAHHRAPRAPARADRHQLRHRARRLPGRPHRRPQHGRRRHRRDHRQGQRRADRSAAEEAARRRHQGSAVPVHQRAGPGRLHQPDPGPATRPPTSWPRAWPSTA